MTNHLNLFATVARIALPTFSVGPIKHVHKAQRTDHNRLPAVGDLLSIINGGIVYCRRQWQRAPPQARIALLARRSSAHRSGSQDAASFNPDSNRSRAGLAARS